MKRQLSCFTLYLIIVYLTCVTLNPAVASPQPQPGDDASSIINRKPNNYYNARISAANLNVGEPRTVRLFYFLPNDRPYRADVVAAMKTGIVELQSFFAEQMEIHGQGRKTFQIETDDQGNPVVHRVDGDYSNSHYSSRGYTEGEIERAYDNSMNVILIIMDVDGSTTGGHGTGGKDRGFGIIFEGWDWFAAAHELGHAFTLHHDFRDDAYIMSYGRRNRSSAKLSACAAEFLAMHPYFNPDVPLENESPPTVKLISSANYPAGAESVPIRLKVRDDNGLHQVLLFVNTKRALTVSGPEVKACHGLAGETDTVVEFNYDGKTPSDRIFSGSPIYTSFSDPSRHTIYVVIVDTDGNRTSTFSPISFTLEEGLVQEISPLSERTPQVRDAIVAAVPDASNSSDVTAADLAEITSLSMLRKNITSLKAGDFDGLSALSHLDLRSNSLTTLPNGIFNGLSTLRYLYLSNNSLTTLPNSIFDELTSLGSLYLSNSSLTTLPNGIFDELTSLESLYLNNNSLTTLPNGIFDRLNRLDTINLSYNFSLTTLPNGIFNGLSALRYLYLRYNSLTTLPEGIFDGHTTLRELKLGSVGFSLPITLSLQKVEEDQFKVVVPTGAPFDIVLPLSVTNGSINGGATTTTIPAGSVESETLTVTRTTGTTAAVIVDIGVLPGLPANHEGYELAKLVDAPLELNPLAGICGRTEEVRNAILNQINGISDCALVTDAHLAAITGMDVTLGSSVKAGDFDGLTGLTALGLDTGQLTSLPAGLFTDLSNVTIMEISNEEGLTTLTVGAFDGLTSLTGLAITARQLTSLPAGVFDNLTNLTQLECLLPQLGTLPNGIFDRLTNLTGLTLYVGQLSRIPDGIFDQLTKLTTLVLASDQLTSLPDGIFDRLPQLTTLRLSRTQLASLPDGLFSGLSLLTSLNLSGNAVDPLPLTVSLEKVGNGQFKAVAPTGAPFDIVLPLTVVNGSINGGVTTTTIPKGSVESGTLTVTRTSGATYVATVDIGTMPVLPANHSGYSIAKSADLPLVFPELGGDIFTLVSQRTPQVRDAIVAAAGVNSADDVTQAHLDAITNLNLSNKSITSLKVGDFDGLTSLTSLILNNNKLTSLPAGIFDNLTALTTLYLYENQLTSLPAGIFDNLTALTNLSLRNNALSSLPAGIFDNNTALMELYLHKNQLSSLPAGIFDNLTALKKLYLHTNRLSSLPDSIFDNLTTLTELHLYTNQLRSLPSGLFNQLIALTWLTLSGNQLSSLPEGIFDKNTALTNLSLGTNRLGSLPLDIFENLTAITHLYMDQNRLSSLPAGIFENLTTLTHLAVDPLPLTISLEKVADGQFKAVVPAGAPFDIVLPIRVTNGSISGGATTLTIPAGSVESGTLTVTRTIGESGAVSVWIGPVPSLPTNHTGYRLVKNTDAFRSLVIFEDISEQIWSGTITLGTWGNAFGNGNATGYGYSSSRNAGNISNATFTHRGTTYTIHEIAIGRIGNNLPYRLTLTISPQMPSCDEQHIGLFGNLFGSQVSRLSGQYTYQWNRSSGDWIPNWGPRVMHLGRHAWITFSPTTPDAPIVIAINEVNQVMLSWTTPCDGGIDITGREYRQKIGNGTFGPWTPIPNSAAGEVNAISYTVVNVNNPLESTFELRAVNELGESLPSVEAIPVSPGFIPVSERTPQVHDLILLIVRARFQQGISAADVTAAHLRSITSLDLRNKSITSLKAGDFSGMPSLEKLILDSNSITGLPADVFDGLLTLKELWLQGNALTDLPSDVFEGLSALERLQLSSNALTGLPADVFEGLSNLTTLDLSPNSITSLPADVFEGLSTLKTLFLRQNELTSLPEDVFDGLSNLTSLELSSNALASLPEGVFDGLSNLTSLRLSSNALTSLPVGMFKGLSNLTQLSMHSNSAALFITVSLEKVGEDQFKATAPTGAPFDIVLPVNITNGSINGGATNITIPQGSVASEILTLTRTPGTSAAVTMDIGTLPSLPSYHNGYQLVKSDDLPLEVISSSAPQVTGVNIPDANLRAKIETALSKASGDPISAAEMETLTSLTAQDASISNLTGLETATNLTTLKLGNNTISNISALTGLTNLTELQLWDNTISDISAVSGLTNLTQLLLWGNTISDISPVAKLTNLTRLYLGENAIANISAVSELTNLTHLYLNENSVSDISAVARLTNLTELRIGDNTVSNISAVANLTNLVWLDARNNTITDISAVMNLTNLTTLTLTNNTITDISPTARLTKLVEVFLNGNSITDISPLVSNTGLGEYTEIDVQGNPLSYPSIYTQIPALQAKNVYIDFDNRVATAPVKISGDTQQGNTGTVLAQPFVVEVQDANSVVFAGVPVTFAVTTGGGTLSATNTTTGANGRTQSTLTLGNSAGTNTVTVSVQGNSQTAAFTATAVVPSVNTAPVFTEGTSTARTIAENTAANVNIGTPVAATDADNDTLTYSLGGADAAAFSIDPTTGQLKTKSALDYETKRTYIVTLTVSDGTLTDTITVTINVTDIDETPVVSTLNLLSGRTPQVRDAIVAAVPGVNSANDVTEAHLAAITSLNLSGKSITSLTANDFSGLSSLTQLYLHSNQLTTLPDGVFAGLSSLTRLNLRSNQLTTLPDGVFAGLSSLTQLYLYSNQLTTLPDGVFAGLSSLTQLYLYSNQLTTLPDGVFAGLSSLTRLNLDNNQLTTLPDGVFAGLSSLTRLNLLGNTVAPLPLTASLEKVGEGQFKAVAPTGAPFDIVLPINVTNGSINGGATTTTISKSSVESDTLRVSRTPGTTAVVTVDIGNLPGLPSNHQGYQLAKSTNLPLEIISLLANSAPVFTESSSTTRSVTENTATGVNIGVAIAATDADNDALTYTLSGTDAASFSIVRTSGQLRTRAALDYETKRTYTVTITVSDGSLADTITVTINVTNVDESPVNVAACQVGDVLAPGESCTYPGTDAEFSVHNNGNGQFLFFTSGSSLNIKNTVINGQSYTLIANKIASGSWKIEEIADSAETPGTTNTAPTFTAGSSTTRTIAENTAANVNIGTPVAATDADNDALTYTLGGTDASAFSIERTTGQLKTRAALDYETKRTYTVTITASDGSLTDTITVSINITDVDDTPVVSTLTLVCDRTPQVRDAIVAAVPSVSDCKDVTEAHLKTIISLDLNDKSITSLKAGDFDGLSSLRTLYLNGNQLTSLPSNLFSGLTTLKDLYLNNNQLTSLPVDLFAGLSSLRQINLHTNRLTNLPAKVFSGLPSLTQIYLRNNLLTHLSPELFSGLSSLQYLYLDNNRLRTLPAGMFSGLSSLTQLLLNNNRLTSLPEGVFRGLTASTWLWLQGNRVDPLPLTVSLEKVGVNQFKASVPAGAPFTIVLPLRVANGTISGGVSTLTIPQGSVESGRLTVTRTPGTTAAVTVDIGTLPGLPTNHQGYQLVKSTDLPLEIFSSPGNSAPTFTEGTSTTRTVTENTASGVNIGTAVTATDADNDTLTYTLSGTDANAFSIESTTGQLQAKSALDYETKTTYTVTLTVSDGSLTDTITVTINVTDIDELPSDTGICQVGDILAPGESCTYPDTDAVFSVLDNGHARWNIPGLPSWLAWANQVSIGGSLSFTATINDDNYHFVAEEVSNDSWEIKEIGEDRTEQPETPEQPGDVGGTPTLSVSTTSPLTEATLDESVVTLTLSGGTYESSSSRIRNAVTVSTSITGVTVRSFDIDRVSDTQVTVELTFDGTDFDTNSTITFTVGAGAITDYDGTALTEQVPVTASTESVVASTTSPLTEGTLDESVVTLTLSGRIYERSGVRIRNAVSVSGISGVTVSTFDVDRVSDTQVTVELTFDGNINTDSTLTFTVGPGAIAGYDGPALTAQVPVSASTEVPEDTDIQDPEQDPEGEETPAEQDYIQGPWLWMIAEGSDIDADYLAAESGDVITETQVAQNGVDEGDYLSGLQWTRGQIYPSTYCTFWGGCYSDNVNHVVNAIGLSANHDLNLYSAYALINIISTRDQNGVSMGVGSDDAVKVWLNGTVVHRNNADRRTTGVQDRFRVNLKAGDNLLLVKVSENFGNWGMFFKIYLDAEDFTTAIPMADTDGQPAQQPDTAPTFIAGSSTSRTIAENTAANVNIGTAITATDADNDTLTYTLGGTNANVFSIERATGQLKTRSTLDYETKRTYSVTITVSDGNLTDSITVTINVTDVAETPAPQQPGDTGGTPTLSISTTSPLTEAALHEGVVTLTLTGGTYKRSRFTIGDALTISGIDGVTIPWHQPDRKSDTQITVELEFNGNINADSTLTFTVGAGAIVDYTGPALTAQIQVTANTESVVASTATTLTEATLHQSVVTLTLKGAQYERSIFDIRDGVSVSGIDGVTFPWHDPDKESDTQITLKLEFNGDFDTDATLTFTVNTDAIAGYNGPNLTTQVSVSAVTESVVASSASPLTETTLDGSVVTLTLSGRKYARFIFDIRDGVSVSGIDGVTFPWHDPDKESDTQITLELEFNGDFDTDATLTFTVGADAIAEYNGPALTAQVSVTATVQVLKAPSGISLLHVPLRVTAVDGVAQTIKSIADLYDALGGMNTVNLLITYDPKTQGWQSYLGESSRGTVADTVLADHQGIIADLKTPVSLQLDGDALGSNGSSVITLHPGTNLMGMSLKDPRITHVSDLFALEGIRDNASTITVLNNGTFQTVAQAGDAGDIPITGGQSFILNAREAATVAISGQGWDNVSGAAAAAPVALTGIQVGDTTPVLALTGSIVSPVGEWGRMPHLRSGSGFRVIVKNLSTRKSVATVTGDTGDSYQLTVVDTETGSAAQIGDILEISVRSPDPRIGVEPLRHTVTAEDVKWSRVELGNLIVYEIPTETALLPNYPNPFNPETWIPYRLVQDAFVTLTIYDGSGQVVRTLDVGHRVAAVYESRSKAIHWDGRNEFGEGVASGVYFYHLSAGDYSATRKMLIVK